MVGSDLELRVAKLEKSARRWRSLAVVAFVGLVGLGAADAAKVPDEIVARSFVVTDATGEKVYGILKADDSNGGIMKGTMLVKSDDGFIALVSPGERFISGKK